MTLPVYVEAHRSDAFRVVFQLLTIGFPVTLRITDCDRPIAYGGNIFTPAPLNVGGVEETSASAGRPSIGGFDVASGNGNVWQTIVSSLTETTRGETTVLFEEAWLDPVTLSGVPLAVRTLFRGKLESAEVTPDGVRITVSPEEDVSTLRFPRREEGVACGYPEFKGPECGYTGRETECDRSAARCTALTNQARFGGFRYVPPDGALFSFYVHDGDGPHIETIVFRLREEE